MEDSFRLEPQRFIFLSAFKAVGENMPNLTNFVGYVQFNPNGTMKSRKVRALTTQGHSLVENEEVIDAIYEGLITNFGYEG